MRRKKRYYVGISMFLPSQRHVVLIGLCTVFGAVVWAANISILDSQVLLAQASSGSSGGAQKESGEALTGSNKQCPAESPTARYNVTKPKYPATYTEGETQIQNLYGKPCYELSDTVFVQGFCHSAGRCNGEQYVGQDGKLHKVKDEAGKLVESLSKAEESGSAEAIKKATDALDEFNKTINPSWFSTSPPSGLGASGLEGPTQQQVDEFLGSAYSNAGPVSVQGYVNPPWYASNYAPVTPSGQIGNIANSGGGQTSGAVSSGPSGAGGSTFSPSPALSGSPFSLGSLFGGGSPSGGGSGGGYAGQGGTIAYVPVNQYPGLTSPNFDARGTGVTFPEPRPSPSDMLAYLAQNTRRQQAERVSPEALKDRGILNSGIVEAINNVVAPVGEFIQSFFTGEDVGAPSGKEVSTAAREEERPPLERGRLVLNLEPGDVLVPGDPTSIANLSRPQYEAFESIPESNVAWVQNTPRAGEGIEGIASAPTYGWGEPSQGEGEAEAGGAGAPQVSEVSYDPFHPLGTIIPGVTEGGSAGEPPRSFFSVMTKSFSTIGEAVGSLFSTIGKSLFWWL